MGECCATYNGMTECDLVGMPYSQEKQCSHYVKGSDKKKCLWLSAYGGYCQNWHATDDAIAESHKEQKEEAEA